MAISPEKRERVFSTDNHKCIVCGTAENLTVDHILPKRLGGTDDEENLQTMCQFHNKKKGCRVKGRYAKWVRKS